MCQGRGTIVCYGLLTAREGALLKVEIYYYLCAMNKPQAKDNLIPVREYALTVLSRRGFPVTVQYIYKLIKEHKKGKVIDFRYREIDKSIWIER